MKVRVDRKQIFFQPDATRVLARYFNLSNERSAKIINRILGLHATSKASVLNQLLRKFSSRHRSITNVWEKNCKRALARFHQNEFNGKELSPNEKLLIGAYFTMEYSIESAALFNPSIVESPDQTQLDMGEKRIILSFRATGEGHVSSIVFRSGIINEKLDIIIDEVGKLLEKPRQFKNHRYVKSDFLHKVLQIHSIDDNMMHLIEDKFPSTFTYEELRRFVKEIEVEHKLNHDAKTLMNQILWVASSHYEMTFGLDTSISERVIFPIVDTEKNGIEDARFVKFINDHDKVVYYATYTAYDGMSILPKLLSTKDFINYKVQPINGKIANKGAALFPRKINGKYAMLCRVDGENNYISFSNDLINWQDEIILLIEPEMPWEFVQMGNCGSPIETEYGWIVFTHSVGPMREYTLGAILLDLKDPTKVIGKVKEPILIPNQLEREGYVPNVVYSCGQILHNGSIIIPYAMSDHSSTYATVKLEDLMQAFE